MELYLWSHLWRAIRFSSGVDLLDATFRHLMGDRSFRESLRETTPSRSVRLEYFLQKTDSTFFSSAHALEPGALFHQFYYSDGDRVAPVNGSLEKVGYQITLCESC